MYKRLPESKLKVNIYHDVLEAAALKLADKLDAVYTDDMVKETGLYIETIRTWLKREGFARAGSIHCKRYVCIGWADKHRVQRQTGASPVHGIPQ
jgi:hypothetical protein